MKLRLSDVAVIADVIGALAIVISLIYVGIQVNDSTRAVRSATANDMSAAISSWYAEIGSNSQATRVFLNGVANPESLSREETAQFIYMMHGLQLEYQAAFYLAQEQTLDVELQEALTNTIAGVRAQPGFKMYWAQRRESFEPDFRTYVDELLTKGVTNTNLERLYRTDDPE
jgi:hypothetical protein